MPLPRASPPPELASHPRLTETRVFTARPRGAAPKGKVWDSRTGTWVADGSSDGGGAAAASPRPSKFPRPRGASPRGQAWDYEVGVWVAVQVEEAKQTEEAGVVEYGDANEGAPMAKRAATDAAMAAAVAANVNCGVTSAV